MIVTYQKDGREDIIINTKEVIAIEASERNQWKTRVTLRNGKVMEVDNELGSDLVDTLASSE